ncbi:unnamed protein product [Clonostachys chloroleuca]|uniref:Uncharacterized protein n=1 Tax=Clonostachys chloroleuca TaxID=1926264 RepID=A0AA35PX58_9HYPO|nr:unnamed protein product [Clonostachys chloroleuca]
MRYAGNIPIILKDNHRARVRQWKENILPGSKSYNIFVDTSISKEEIVPNALINRTTAEASIEFAIFNHKIWPLKEKPIIMTQTPYLHQKILFSRQNLGNQ